MKRNIIYILSLFSMLLLTTSCSESELDYADPNSMSSTTFPQDESELVAGINAIYSPLQSFGLYARYIPFMFDNMAHDNEKAGNLSADLQDFLNFTFTPSNNDIYLYWKNCYNGIFRANMLLDQQERVANIDGITDEMKNKYLGEAYFLRAFYYFRLTSRFGDIPLYTTSNVGPEGLPKSSQEEVYQRIIDDLTEAINLLRTKSAEEEWRATKGAARGLLAKVYLYRKEYSQAKSVFDAIINSGEYSLVADYFDNFKSETEHNSESLFEVKFKDEYNRGWGSPGWSGFDGGDITLRSIEYGVGGWHNVNPADALVNQFEANDPRREASFYFDGSSFGISGGTITQEQIGSQQAAWRKYQLTYKQNGEAPWSDINFRVIRYADVLLMAAEVENELGNTTAAINLLNQVRERVSMPKYGSATMNAIYPVGSKQEVFEAIVHERQVELAGEQVRFPDLVRWDLAESVLGEYGFVKGKHEIFPIPQNEINTNQSLSSSDQNSGY